MFLVLNLVLSVQLLMYVLSLIARKVLLECTMILDLVDVWIVCIHANYVKALLFV